MNKKFIILLIGIGVIAPGFFSAIYAQSRTGLSISPLIFELTANPGDVLINQVRITNSGDSVLGVKMEIEDFSVAGELGHVQLEPAETETYSIARWIKFEPAEFILEPKEYKFVNFIISAPEKAEPGGHYGSIIAGTTSIAGGDLTGMAVASRVGTLVLLSISGEVKENLAVKEFLAPNYSEYGPVPFVIRFENAGTVHVKPTGFITVTNWLGKKVVDIEIPQRNVLPGSIRKIEVFWNQKWLWFGKYTATISGSYGMNNTPFRPAVIVFWAFPWKAGVIIFLILLFFILTRKRWIGAFRVLIKGEKA